MSSSLRSRILILICLLLVAAPVAAQEIEPIATPLPVPVRVDPAVVEIGPGDTVDVAVMVDGVRQLYGFDVTLTFDPAVVQVVDANPNTPDRVEVSLGTFLEPGFEVRNVADNSAGTIQYVMTQINPSPPQDGSGTLLVARFRGLVADASSPVHLEAAMLGQPRGIVFPGDTSGGDGEIRVVANPAGTAGAAIPSQSGNRADIEATVSAMEGRAPATDPSFDAAPASADNVDTAAPEIVLPPPSDVATAGAPPTNTQITLLLGVSALILLLLAAVLYMLWRLRHRDSVEDVVPTE